MSDGGVSEPTPEEVEVDGDLEVFVSKDSRYCELRVTALGAPITPEAFMTIIEHIVETYSANPAKFFGDWGRYIPERNDLC